MTGLAGLLRIAASAVVTALVIAACAPRPEPDGEPEASSKEAARNGDNASDQEAPFAETTIAENATLRLEVGTTAPVAGQPIAFVLIVMNRGGDELVIDFPDGQRFDFEVIGDGTTVWRWGADMFFTQMLGRERIAAGASELWTATLEAGLSAGTYTVRGTLTTNTRHALDLAFEVEAGEAR
jgi:hypothetical protein